ncbi:hypothetical protein GCM10009838_30980 [Catenulispora subtropica]|uniref:Uncharacterized protein n=1 Tax=Catenulispora subtropica TaxID=450798 RepID=A0ABP5CW47_9ACTN
MTSDAAWSACAADQDDLIGVPGSGADGRVDLREDRLGEPRGVGPGPAGQAEQTGGTGRQAARVQRFGDRTPGRRADQGAVHQDQKGCVRHGVIVSRCSRSKLRALVRPAA